MCAAGTYTGRGWRTEGETRMRRSMGHELLASRNVKRRRYFSFLSAREKGLVAARAVAAAVVWVQRKS